MQNPDPPAFTCSSLFPSCLLGDLFSTYVLQWGGSMRQKQKVYWCYSSWWLKAGLIPHPSVFLASENPNIGDHELAQLRPLGELANANFVASCARLAQRQGRIVSGNGSGTSPATSTGSSTSTSSSSSSSTNASATAVLMLLVLLLVLVLVLALVVVVVVLML